MSKDQRPREFLHNIELPSTSNLVHAGFDDRADLKLKRVTGESRSEVNEYQTLADTFFAGLLSSNAWASNQAGPDGKKLFEQGKYQQALAYYNLGLVARATGDKRGERHYFLLAANQRTNGKIRALARERLGNPGSHRQHANHWIAIVRARAGHDSNAPRLAEDLLTGGGSGSDNYMQWLGYAQTWLGGGPGHGVKFYGLAFDRQFQRFSSLDTQVLGGNLSREHPVGALDTEAALRVMHMRFGGAPLANQLQAFFRVMRCACEKSLEKRCPSRTRRHFGPGG